MIQILQYVGLITGFEADQKSLVFRSQLLLRIKINEPSDTVFIDYGFLQHGYLNTGPIRERIFYKAYIS